MTAQLGCWVELAGACAGLAMARLSQMTGRGIESSCALVAPADMARHWRRPGIAAVAVEMTLSGAGSGRILMLYEPDSAKGFADLLMGRSPGTTRVLGETERAALCDLGKIVGGSFANAVAAGTGLSLSLSAPSVTMAAPDAVLSAVAGDPLPGGGMAQVAMTRFVTSDRRMRGVFVAVPNADLLRVLSQERLRP